MTTTISDHIIPPRDFLTRTARHPLDYIFAPRNVAVIGASERTGSVGSAIMRNLTTGSFNGSVLPVNPKRASVMGLKSWPSICEISDRIDLAVIAAPASMVPEVIRQCAEKRVPGAIIISAGFREFGAEGAALETQVLAEARRGGMRIVGPNCLGVMNPHVGLNATFAAAMARPGNVGFVSQSGALCTAILDWSFREGIGFSAFVSVGSMLDVSWGDLIDYLGDDPATKSIVLYMESIGDARSFLSAAREVAMTKPIIVIKVGRTEAASKAAASHTGALTGSDEVLDAAFNRVGALRVRTISELFDMVEVLARQPRPAGPRLTIITNAGGPGVLATDMLITTGGELAPIPNETMTKLGELLPPHWSRGNPIDVLGDASPQRYIDAVEIAAKNPDSDGTLVVLTPQAMTDPTETATRLAMRTTRDRKPILASWMGGASVGDAKLILHTAGIPNFEFPDAAARAFSYMWKYSSNLDALYETPTLAGEISAEACAHVMTIVEQARCARRTILNEFESKQILQAYGIPTVTTLTAKNPDEAVSAAHRVGYPVVLKLLSNTITHKTDVGGVKLQLTDADAVANAYAEIERSVTEKCGAKHFQGVTVQSMIRRGGYEIILGSSCDPQLGPVILFGTGGELVEVFKDRAVGLPPLNTTLARRVMERTKIYKALKGVRGRKAVDIDAIEKCLVHFSQLVADQKWIKEIDINPLLVSAENIIAVDARVVLHDPEIREADLSRPAIRAYPMQYVTSATMKNGETVTIRPIRPEDEPLMIAFHRTLSDQTVHQRYLGMLKLETRIAHQRLRRVCFTDFDREMVFVVERTDAVKSAPEIIGVGRLNEIHGHNDAEFAIVISTPWQGQGLGTQLLRRLIEVGRKEKLSGIVATILPDNREMIAICRKLGFQVRFDADATLCHAALPL